MITLYADRVKKRQMDPLAVSALEEECALYQRLLHQTVQMYIHCAPEDRNKLQADVYWRNSIQVQVLKEDGSTEIKYIPQVPAGMCRNLVRDAKAVIESRLALQDLNIENKKVHLADMNKRSETLKNQLASLMIMKQSLIARSKAKKAGTPVSALPGFRSGWGGCIQAKDNGDGSLTITVDTWRYAHNHSRKKKRPSPLVFENEWLFELKFLNPRIRKLKRSIGCLNGRLHNEKAVLAQMEKEKEEGRVRVCFGSRKLFLQQYETPSRKEKRESQRQCKGGRTPHSRDWRRNRTRPRRKNRTMTEAERRIRNQKDQTRDRTSYPTDCIGRLVSGEPPVKLTPLVPAQPVPKDACTALAVPVHLPYAERILSDLEAQDIQYHQQWLADFRKARNRPMMLNGRVDQVCGNLLVEYHPDTEVMLYKTMKGKKILLHGIHFRYGQEWVRAAVMSHDIEMENRKIIRANKKRREKEQSELPLLEGWKPMAVGWSIKDCGTYFDIRCHLDIPNDPSVSTDMKAGCVAFDMNWDHLGVAELGEEGAILLPPTFWMDQDGKPYTFKEADSSGNIVEKDVYGRVVHLNSLTDSERERLLLVRVSMSQSAEERRAQKAARRQTHPARRTVPEKPFLQMSRIAEFSLEGKTSEQIETELSLALEHVFLWAKITGKPVAMEDIEKLSKNLLYGSAKRNRHISMFAYNKMTELADGKGLKYGLYVRKVNPAFTSQIAKLKYMRPLGISIHEAAAAVIGRRAMGRREPLKKGMKALLTDEVQEKGEWSKWGSLAYRLSDIPTHKFYRDIKYENYRSIDELKKALRSEKAS